MLELKTRAATLVTLTIVTFGDRNILLSVSYQECNRVSSSVGSEFKKKKTLSLLSVRNLCNLTGGISTLKEKEVWICLY